MKEIWKDIVGFKGYQISNLGRVKSLRRKYRKNDIFLRPGKCTKGYLKVVLSSNKKFFSKRVHTLVARAFLCVPTNKKLQINHLDGNKLNNVYSNLEWCTCKENIRHAINNKLRNPNQYY